MRRIAVAVLTFALLLGVSAGSVAAQALDAASLEALATTLRMLQDPGQRGAAIAGDQPAGAIDARIRSMAGSDPKAVEEFYALAAQVFDELTRGSGGDGKKMSEALSRGQSDPAAFASMLSPGTRERLRELSIKMSDRPR